MNTYSDETIKQNLIASCEAGKYPKFLHKHFYNEIKKAMNGGYSMDNCVFVNYIHGDNAEIPNSGFMLLEYAEKAKYADFYFVDMSGLVERWFPGIDIAELKPLQS
jgi:hypothetical protein